jgi:hypothetical protein
MSQEMIAKVEEEIAKTRRELKSKQLLLTLIKAQNKEPFIKTKIGKFCLKIASSATSGLAKLHKTTTEALEYPELVMYRLAHEEGERLLAKAAKIPDRNHKKATAMAIECAEMKIKLENLGPTAGPVGPERIIRLAAEVERLRQPRSPEDQAKIQQAANEVVSQASGLAASLNLADQPF